MIYRRLLRPLLFTLDPETAHDFVLAALRFIPRVNRVTSRGEPVRAFGLTFRHRLGLAAGFDKNALALPAWETLGFAFAEIGTVTAQRQPGNPPPRIFRHPQHQALINRLGFNNDGALTVAERLARLRDRGKWPRIPIGINIGKSRDVPIERAGEDYLFSFRLLRPYASYVAVNVSSPNTPGLRDLQEPVRLNGLLRYLNSERGGTPLLVKIAPDLEVSLLDEIVAVCQANDIAGIIATNTTLNHSGITNDQDGGLSGAPLREKSTRVVRYLTGKTKIPIVGCGGVLDMQSAKEKIEAGATLLQVYTGLIYRGPALIRELARL